MAQLTLDDFPSPFAEPVEEAPAPSSVPSSLQLTFATLPPGYLPGRGLFASSILHELAIFAILFLASHNFANPVQVRSLSSLDPHERLVFLPVLGGGHEGDGHSGGGSGVPAKVSEQVPARSSKGLSYSGTQPIFSNPPDPLNFNQTLLQSGLKKLPILQKFVPLPNLVQSANAAPLDVRANKSSLPPKRPSPIAPPKIALSANAPMLAAVSPVLPTLRPSPPPDAPKLTIPLQARGETRLTTSVAPPPVENVPKVSEAPRVEQLSQLPTRGTGLRNIVALSPTPTAPQASPKIPSAETRGRFAVSPEANTASATPLPGSKSASPAVAAAGIGNNPTAPLGNAAAEVAAGAGNNHGVPLNGGGGNGSGSGTGDAAGSGNGGAGNGTGRGASVGSALGTGAGLTTGSGTGSGSGHGGGHFAGITIQGGRLVGGITAANLHGATPVPAQTSYGMTIVSTASSGGGLPDYGVFSGEKVYTVYLDARTNTDDPSFAWTLQYAPVRETNAVPNADGPARAAKGPTPPYAMFKEIPRWPAELVRRYLQRVIVVSGVISTEGKLDQMLIVQSPDDRLTEGITEALNKWVFRPAEINGHPIAVKIMLGIPLSLSQ